MSTANIWGYAKCRTEFQIAIIINYCHHHASCLYVSCVRRFVSEEFYMELTNLCILYVHYSVDKIEVVAQFFQFLWNCITESIFNI